MEQGRAVAVPFPVVEGRRAPFSVGMRILAGCGGFGQGIFKVGDGGFSGEFAGEILEGVEGRAIAVESE